MNFRRTNIGEGNTVTLVYDSAIGTKNFRIFNAQSFDKKLKEPDWYVTKFNGFKFQKIDNMSGFDTSDKAKNALIKKMANCC
jgi:hypothetical protein